MQRHQTEKPKQSCRTTPKPNWTDPIWKAIYNRPISQLGLCEWIRNNSTLKNTKPGHAILNANNNNGRNAVNSQFQLRTYGKWEECVLSNAKGVSDRLIWSLKFSTAVWPQAVLRSVCHIFFSFAQFVGISWPRPPMVIAFLSRMWFRKPQVNCVAEHTFFQLPVRQLKY